MKGQTVQRPPIPTPEGWDGDDFRAARKEKQEQHGRNHVKNMAILEKSGLAYTVTNGSQCILFRIPGYPVTDFYPSSGKWRAARRTYWGGATSCINWMEKRRKRA